MSRCGATWQGRGVYWAPEASTNIRHRQNGALSLIFRPILGTDWPDTNLETGLDGRVKQGNLIERISNLELEMTGEKEEGTVLERLGKLEAVLGVSGAPPGS